MPSLSRCVTARALLRDLSLSLTHTKMQHNPNEQQRFNYQDGAFVIRMLGHKQGSPNVWPVTSGAGADLSFDGVMSHKASTRGASLSSSSPSASLRPSPVSVAAAQQSALPPPSYNSRRWVPGMPITTFPGHSILTRRPHIDSVQAAAGPGTWLRPGKNLVRGAANVWHTDDQYTLEPPWATVLRAVTLPEVREPCDGACLTNSSDWRSR